jgi:WD40 repeat protein
MTDNPFPGPQPFRAMDRARFHGREDLSRRLEGAILVHRAVVVHGPSGSGKSSLIQASVLPHLQDAEDVRVVHLDGWPSAEDPTHWLSMAMHSELKHGEPDIDISPSEAVLSSLKRAVRGSSRILVICIDQLEQLLYPGRDSRQTETFFDCVNDILDLPLRTLRVVMSLREDYLGVFRDRLRDHRRVLGQGFRVGPLTVGELTQAMCQTATSGQPPQVWAADEMRALLMQVRVPGQAESDEAEAQAAYGQIVCRALFQERAAGETNKERIVEAEPILQRYLEMTLADLGPLRNKADRLLEDHLVSGDGGRTLRTEKELQRHFSAEDLQTILGALEQSAILHAASHQGSRYFEIGHDWLARKVFEKRQAHEQKEEQRRRDQEQQRALENVRKERRVLIYVAAFLLVGVVGIAVSALSILTAKRKAELAEDAANRAALVAQRREIDARDASILAGVRELSSRGKLTWAMKLLPKVQLPELRRGWVALASDLLAGNTLVSTLEGHSASLTTAVFSPDGKLILTASIDGTARLWDAAGKIPPIVLSGHTDALTFATWSHDGKYVLTASLDGTARIFDLTGKGKTIGDANSKVPITYADFSPDDSRVVTASQDGFVRIHGLSGEPASVEIQGSKKAIYCVRFHPDGERVFFSSQDENVQVWDGKPITKPVEIGTHDGAVVFLDIKFDGSRLVSASIDGTARIWDISAKKSRLITTIQHDGPVHHAIFSPKGVLVATASADRMARVVRVDGSEPPIVLSGHTQAVTRVAFDPTGYFLATASQDATGRIFRIQGGVSLVLRGHEAAVHSIAWKSDGAMVVTAAGDGTDRSPDETARVWSTVAAQRLGLGSRGPRFFHSAAATFSVERLATVHNDGATRVTTLDKVDEPIVLPSPGAWVANASLSADGQFVATASFDKLVRVFQVDKPTDVVTLSGHEAEVRFALFSPDGKRVLSGGDDGRAIVFAVDGKTAPIRLEGHRDWLTAGAWSADGKRVVTGSFDHTARVWNADGQGAATELVGHQGEVLAVAFFSDNRRIATASADHTARIWIPGQEPRILQHEAAVYNIAVSPDNKFIATYAADHLIRIWRVSFPDPPIELESTVPVRLLAFEPNGPQIAALDEEGSLHTWTVDVDALRERIAVANADCLPSSIRVLYLNETLAVAEERYATCKRSPYEMPWFNAVDKTLLEATSDVSTESAPARIVSTPTLKELGSDMVRVKVVVLPTEAEVQIDGIPTPRRQGVVEFVGKIGQKRTLLVQRGAKHRSFEVTIGANGASPAQFDLNEKLPATVRPGVDATDKPIAPEKNPLLPDTNE